MGYFAKVVNGIVQTVIVADASFFNTFVDSSPGMWIETFQNGGQRKNFAGIGFSYDKSRNAFIPPRPYPSWNLNETTCRYEAPTPYPNDGESYRWDEEAQEWIQR